MQYLRRQVEGAVAINIASWMYSIHFTLKKYEQIIFYLMYANLIKNVKFRGGGHGCLPVWVSLLKEIILLLGTSIGL